MQIVDIAADRANLAEAWDRLIDARPGAASLYQTRAYYEQCAAVHPHQRSRLFCAWGDEGELTGVVPLVAGVGRLERDIRGRTIWRSGALKSLEIGLRDPLLPEDSAVYRELFQFIDDQFADASMLRFSQINVDSHFYRSLQALPEVRDRYVLHDLEGCMKRLIIDLPETFSAYLGRFAAEKRYKLRRIVKKLGERCGTLVLERFDRPEQVTELIARASSIAKASWQAGIDPDQIGLRDYHEAKLKFMASRGQLAAYILSAGGKDCAYTLGYEGCGQYEYVQPRFDRSFAHHSPGTALLVLMIEDLIGRGNVRRFSFGAGEYAYKQHFANDVETIRSFYLLRKTLRNRILTTTDRFVYAGLEAVKRVARRRGTASLPVE